MTIDEMKEEAVRVNRRMYGLLAAFERKTGVRVDGIEIRRSRVTRISEGRRQGDIEFVGVKVHIDGL